jgi:hypothetical protein
MKRDSEGAPHGAGDHENQPLNPRLFCAFCAFLRPETLRSPIGREKAQKAQKS